MGFILVQLLCDMWKFTNDQRIDTSVNVITMVTDQVHMVMCVGPDSICSFPAPGSIVSEAELSVRECNDRGENGSTTLSPRSH